MFEWPHLVLSLSLHVFPFLCSLLNIVIWPLICYYIPVFMLLLNGILKLIHLQAHPSGHKGHKFMQSTLYTIHIEQTSSNEKTGLLLCDSLLIVLE